MTISDSDFDRDLPPHRLKSVAPQQMGHFLKHFQSGAFKEKQNRKRGNSNEVQIQSPDFLGE